MPPAPTFTPIPPTAAPVPEQAIGVNVGDIAPVFTLPSARSVDYPLDAYRGNKNVALVFYRAFW